MRTAVEEEPKSEYPELVKFRKTDAAIQRMAAEYMPLKISGLDDKFGFAAVHEARMAVKNTRINIEKKRVELKADALAYGRAVDAEAKRLTGMIEPIETHLQIQEDAVVKEKERIKREEEDRKRAEEEAAERVRQAAIQRRIDALVRVECMRNPHDVAYMTDEEFQAVLLQETEKFEERKRVAAIEAEKRKAEEAALAAERARFAEVQRQQDEEAARLRAEAARIAELESARLQAIEIEKAKKEAAEKARIETEQRIAREQEQLKRDADLKAAREKANAEAAEEARLKAESERPWRDRLVAVASEVEAIIVPTCPVRDDVVDVLTRAADRIRAFSIGYDL